MKFLRKLQTHWSRRKWYILSGAAVLSTAIAFAFWPMTRSGKIESALSKYHGGAIKGLSFWPTSENAPDSILIFNLKKEHSRLCDVQIWASTYGAELTYQSAADSAFKIRQQLRSVESRIRKAPAQTYTACAYMVCFDSDTQKRVDTFSAVLNENLRVVWSGKK